MMITRKLYDTDSHIREFEARVLACREVQGKGKKTCFAAELDQTAFFAEGGGQAADRGIIQSSRGEELKVLDVQEKDGHVLHFLEKTSLLLQDRLSAFAFHSHIQKPYRPLL